LPVERVSGKDVQNFIAKLNAKTGKNYRLPTEDEWFFACQAGKSSDYCGSDNIEAVAWYHGNSGNTTHAVGKKAANAWGLYDMSGNVMEWANSCYEANCSLVLRGGSWRGSDSSARFVIRFSDAPNYRFNSIGFRLALNR
jgi:formylglycine-generating enzyme required for sulfatase activity